MSEQLPTGEDFLGNVVSYLIEGEEREAALLLLGCQCQVELGGDQWNGSEAWNVRIGAPRRVLIILKEYEHPLREVVHAAISDVVSAYGSWLREMVVYQN